jgi:hypothetical protein
MAANGWSTRRLANELAITQSNVVRALALLELPATIQEQVEQGSLAPAIAYEFSKVDPRPESAPGADRARGVGEPGTVRAVNR